MLPSRTSWNLAPPPFGRPLLRSAALSCAFAAVVALGAGAIRLLPWALDATVPWRVLAPFARGVAVLATEVAVLLGWPVGLALALESRVERGEWRGLEALGERPTRALLRLAPTMLVPSLLLAAAAVLSARDAQAPGQVANELIVGGQRACATTRAAVALRVPIVDATWLCAPGRTPRIVARAPGAMGGLLVTAEDVQIDGDFRRLELLDARTTLPAQKVQLHVGRLTLRGLAPWFRASTFPAWARASALVLTLIASSACIGLVCFGGMARGRIRALAVGASGPVAALLLMRALERADAKLAAYGLLPVAAIAMTLAVAVAGSRLPSKKRAATSK